MKRLHDVYRDANTGNKKILASRGKTEFYNKNKEHVGRQVGSNSTNDKQHIPHCTFTNQRAQSYLLGFYWLTKLRFGNPQVRVHT